MAAATKNSPPPKRPWPHPDDARPPEEERWRYYAGNACNGSPLALAIAGVRATFITQLTIAK